MDRLGPAVIVGQLDPLLLCLELLSSGRPTRPGENRSCLRARALLLPTSPSMAAPHTVDSTSLMTLQALHHRTPRPPTLGIDESVRLPGAIPRALGPLCEATNRICSAARVSSPRPCRKDHASGGALHLSRRHA
jgi:hypothetical protein